MTHQQKDLADCPETRMALAVWSPHDADLPDRIALHVDACPRCAQQFAARFPPWEFLGSDVAPAPARVASAAVAMRGRRVLGGVAMAAGLLLLTDGGGTELAEAREDEASSGGERLAWLWPDESPLTAEEQQLTLECLLLQDDWDQVCPSGEDTEWL